MRLSITPGTRFGRLVVERESTTALHGSRAYRRFECRCDCGRVVSVLLGNLRSKGTKSCGCLAVEIIRKRCTRHGSATVTGETPEYRAWVEMRRRCRDKSRDTYSSYVKRGISVCERWTKFENFADDVGPRPSVRHSIDRIDNARSYEPDNVRWAEPLLQARNRRSNTLITVYGQTRCLSEWSDVSGIPAATINSRLRSGWSEEDAVTTPSRSYCRQTTDK